jgi:hypothetical protein
MASNLDDGENVIETIELQDFSAEWEEIAYVAGRTTRRRFRLDVKRRRFALRTKIVVAGVLLLVAIWLRPDLAEVLMKEVSHAFRGP